MIENWNDFFSPYGQAVEELKVKLKGLRNQYHSENIHSPIEFVTGRVKPVDSILSKMKLRSISYEKLEQEMYDIAGLRIMCQFVDDITEIVELIRKRKDMKVVEEKDYILHKKESGYRSYHMIIEYPVQLIDGEKRILVEIQIRTLSMNFWATIEHSLNYKYQDDLPENLRIRLRKAAEAAFKLDEEMSQIREEIR